MFVQGFTKAFLGLVLLCGANYLIAQSERGTITGTIRDTTGAVIPGAKITITNTATGIAANLSSNEIGEYTVPNLQVGNYNVQVEKEGFKAAVLTALTVNARSEEHT